MQAAPPGFLTLKDAATRSGINLGILKRDQHNGKIESRKVGKYVYVSIAALDDFTVDWFSRKHLTWAREAREIVAATPPALPSLRDLIEALHGG
jgi:hypothetical protein